MNGDEMMNGDELSRGAARGITGGSFEHTTSTSADHQVSEQLMLCDGKIYGDGSYNLIPIKI